MENEPKSMSIEDKLGLLLYKNDTQTHIKIKDQAKCQACVKKPCLSVCPAKVYQWNETKKETHAAHENCIECGAARMLCPYDNIDWNPPRGGFGVQYKYG